MDFQTQNTERKKENQRPHLADVPVPGFLRTPGLLDLTVHHDGATVLPTPTPPHCELATPPPGFGECAGPPCVVVVLHRPLARKLVVADRNVDAAYFMSGAGLSARKPRNTQTRHGTRFETMSILVKALECVTKRLQPLP